MSSEEIHNIKATKCSHGGGDQKLATNFVAVLLGKKKSITTLYSGLESALLCLNAKKSADTYEYFDVNWDWAK